MRLSTRGRYAVMALTEIAAREACAGGCCRPVSLTEIAASQLLSVAYLEQLFGRLRRCGLVCSARGPGGGYRLARPAEAISIGEIVAAADEPLGTTRCGEEGQGCLAGAKCPTHDLWAELGEQIRLFLESVTLADVVRGAVRGRARAPAAVRAEAAAAAE